MTFVVFFYDVCYDQGRLHRTCTSSVKIKVRQKRLKNLVTLGGLKIYKFQLVPIFVENVPFSTTFAIFWQFLPVSFYYFTDCSETFMELFQLLKNKKNVRINASVQILIKFWSARKKSVKILVSVVVDPKLIWPKI